MNEYNLAEQHLIQELQYYLRAKKDGSGKNLLVPTCPFCGKQGGKFGIYIGPNTHNRKRFMSHCFACGASTFTLTQLLEAIGRPDLLLPETTDISQKLNIQLRYQPQDEEIDDGLKVVQLPNFFKRVFNHPYLNLRGFTDDDYDYFPVGLTCGFNPKFADYIVFPIVDNNEVVGYVGRHLWSKGEIDAYNEKVKRSGGYKILRYRNSTENNFSKLLYNIDAVIQGVTETVIITEGIFDVIALTRKLNLYESEKLIPVATFGKKISDIQMYKLQRKNVRKLIIGYDGDAVAAIQKTAAHLSPYFDILIADIVDPQKDWDDLSVDAIDDIFRNRLFPPIKYKLTKVQEL